MQGLQPVNVTGAIIVVQLCLLIIIALGIFTNFERLAKHNKQKSYGATIVLAVFSLMAVAMSADFYAIWSPILGDVSLPTIARSNAFAWVFSLDIVITILLVLWSGGTMASPFTAILFLIPALAIFLRETPAKFFAYATFVGLYYFLTIGLDMRRFSALPRDHELSIRGGLSNSALGAHRVVNIGCLILATLTGYITRPVPL